MDTGESPTWKRHTLRERRRYSLCLVKTRNNTFDGDLVMTTNSSEFINGRISGLPITYSKNSAKKRKIEESELFVSDMYSFDSQIGTVTNYSTSMYCMLKDYKEGSLEHNELIRRLRICRKEQGSQIDKTKGLLVKDFPKNWIRFQEVEEFDSEEVIKQKEFENSLVIHKKPMFMRWLYKNLNQKYNQALTNANRYCEIVFGKKMDEIILSGEMTDSEKAEIEYVFKKIPLNLNNCTMNEVCRHMENMCKLIKLDTKESEFDYTIMIDSDIEINEKSKEYQAVLSLYKNFVKNKNIHAYMMNTFELNQESAMLDQSQDSTVEQMYKAYRNDLQKACPNKALLANIIVDICYRKIPSSNKDFLWQVNPNCVLANIRKNKQRYIFIPIRDDNGSMEYLNEYYRIQEVKTI